MLLLNLSIYIYTAPIDVNTSFGLSLAIWAILTNFVSINESTPVRKLMFP